MGKKEYIGPVTGKVYDLAAGEKIDPEAEGIGCSGLYGSPDPRVNGVAKYRRIFIRRRRPEEILNELDFDNEERLRTQINALCQWFKDFAGQDVELIFQVRPIIK